MNKILNIIRRSFSLKLSFYNFISIGILFCVIFLFYLRSSYMSLEESSVKDTKQMMEIGNLELTNMFNLVSNVGDNYTLSDIDFTEEKIIGLTRQMVERNTNISLACIALEPDIVKKNDLYSVIAVKEKDTNNIKISEAGSIENYDYRFMEWYQIPKLIHKSYWSEPSYSHSSGTLSLTYTSPIYDKNDNFKGVISLEIDIEKLASKITEKLPYNGTKLFVIGRNGTYIYNDNKDYIGNETVFSLARLNKDTTLYNLGQKMIDSKSGTIQSKINGEVYQTCYSPLGNIGWSMAISFPEKVVYASLNSTIRFFFFITIMGLICLFLFTYFIARKMCRPLNLFAASAKKIATGKFDTKLPVISSKDEMLELHNSFDYMQKALSSYVEKLRITTSAKEKIESELRIARKIQMGMVPKLFPSSPNWKGISLFASLTPAKEVGGDLYDFFIIENKLYYVIGDVSGKGVPASLLMAVTHSLIRSNAANFDSPSKIVKNLNKSVSENNKENMFITLFFGILDLKTGHMKFCNGGHNPPVIAIENEVKYIEVKPNLPVGIMEDFEFAEQETDIKPGTVLFLYTDGLTEAENAEKMLYGEEKLSEVIKENINNSPKTMIRNVIKSVNNHVNGAPQSDDLTMMAFKYEKPFEISFKMDSKTLVLTNKVEQIEDLKNFIESISEEMKFPHSLVNQLNVALEEAVSNIMLYAYKDVNDEEKKKITLKAEVVKNQLIFTIKDSGRPFDPTLEKDPDISLSAEEREIGGLGIFIIKQVMNEVTYSRVEDENVFVLKKKLEK